jgi:hypothetical protein
MVSVAGANPNVVNDTVGNLDAVAVALAVALFPLVLLAIS